MHNKRVNSENNAGSRALLTQAPRQSFISGQDKCKNKAGAAGCIEPSSDQLFTDAPLRLMRAFRFSALFNAEFSPQQHKMIVAQAHLL